MDSGWWRKKEPTGEAAVIIIAAAVVHAASAEGEGNENKTEEKDSFRISGKSQSRRVSGNQLIVHECAICLQRWRLLLCQVVFACRWTSRWMGR